jgi:hypothetical protein
VILELRAQHPLLNAADRGLVVGVRALLSSVLRCRVMTIREVWRSVLVNVRPVLTVSMIESEWAGRLVDGDLVVINTETTDLGVLVREVPPGQKGVVGEVDTWHDLRRRRTIRVSIRPDDKVVKPMWNGHSSEATM